MFQSTQRVNVMTLGLHLLSGVVEFGVRDQARIVTS